MVLGVGDGGQGAPQIREKKYFSGKHHVIFGHLIYCIFGRRKNRHPLFFDSILFLISCVCGIYLEFRNPFFIFLRYRA